METKTRIKIYNNRSDLFVCDKIKRGNNCNWSVDSSWDKLQVADKEKNEEVWDSYKWVWSY
jgi:hypothetical protein